MSLPGNVISLLAPPQCVGCGREGNSLCNDCAGTVQEFGQRCWRCNRLSLGSATCPGCQHTGSPRHVFIHTTHDGLPRALINVFKFGHQRTAAPVISGMMARAFINITGRYDNYLIVPVPTATAHRRQRGFGHTELLARQLSRKLGQPYKAALGRLDQTSQLGSKREDRLRQLADKFYVRKPALVSGSKILLIDDIVTTGGTIIAANQALRSAGASRVDALLFAKRL